MTEYERIRGQIARWIMGRSDYDELPQWQREEALDKADEILSLEVYKGTTLRDLIEKGLSRKKED